MRIGVVVGRFQVPDLHAGHRHVIDTAIAESDHIKLFIGVAKDSKQDVRNPLDYLSRAKMIKELYGSNARYVYIFPIMDEDTDKEWNNSLNGLLSHISKNNEITLYGSRDSFLKTYDGKFPVKYVEPIESESGTEVRTRTQPSYDRSYRLGVIDTINKLEQQKQK